MKIIELVNSMSAAHTMRNSKLNKNTIIGFQMPFSVADLTNIELNQIKIPEKIYGKSSSLLLTDFNEKIIQINSLQDCKFRIWCSHFDSDTYIFLCYICNYLKDKNCNLYVVFSDEYNNDYCTPAVLLEKDFEKAIKYEKKLTLKDISKLSKEWEYVCKNNCDVRVMKNKTLQLVSYDYFNEIILNTLSSLGKVKISRLVGELLSKYFHISDIIYSYLIDRLVKLNKIKIIEESNERYFDNVVEYSKGDFND